MSIYKWLDDEETKQKKKEKDEYFNSLPKEKVQDLKKKSIKKVIQSNNIETITDNTSNELIQDIIEFKNWLDTRTYLKGDMDRIETWIRILNRRIEFMNRDLNKENERSELIEKFRKLPIDFLEEKERIAINKKLKGIKMTSSDSYYLRKLKLKVESKLAYAKYFLTIKRILDL